LGNPDLSFSFFFEKKLNFPKKKEEKSILKNWILLIFVDSSFSES